MLRLIIILIFGSLSLITSAQSCIPDYISFYRQGQIDSFQINYPGCTEIEGDVYISGNNIINLGGLSVLTSIGGDLRIQFTSSLTKLYGLNNLTYIGNDLDIKENEALFNLEGLEGLLNINGSLIIKENSSLTSLTGLENLTTIGNNLNIGSSNYWTGNPLLINLVGLNSISSIGNSLSIKYNHGLTDLSGIENLSIVDHINISSNDNLSSLNGLQGVKNVDGYITISWNESLNSLYGLDNIETAGNIILHVLTSLTDLSGLELLWRIDNDLTISRNSILNNIDQLDSLIYIGGRLTIDRNYFLHDLSGLENLSTIGADLEISYNYSLTNIDALSSVGSIGGDLLIIGNSDLTSLDGLSGITSIDGDLKLSGGNVTSLSGIENIDATSINDLNISWMTELTDCAYQNLCDYLSNPNGVVDIYRNGFSCNSPGKIASGCGITLPCLPYGNYYFIYQYEVDSFQSYYPDCTDLTGIISISGGWGSANDQIANLDGLSVINSINGALAISGAQYLNNISGIENLDVNLISNLIIRYCQYLSECEVQSICDYVNNPAGGLLIEENAIGCNNPEEVQDACESVIIKDHIIETPFKIFPNPASQYLLIENKSTLNIENILIYNTIGQIVYSQDYIEPMIHISDLNQGVYILEVITDDLKKRMKFVKGN